MDKSHPESLHPETWFARLQRMADAIDDLDNAKSETLIRQAYHIVRLAPGPLRHLFRSELAEEDLEGLLNCGAFESAMFELMSPPLALDISRDLHSDEIHAKIAIDDDEVCGSGAHASAAKAALSAWTHCLMKLSEVARRDAHSSKPA